MATIIHTVNGILSTGSRTTDRMGTRLAMLGHTVNDINQPIRSAWSARWKVNNDARDIIEQVQDGDVIIAHSYGCLKTAIAMRNINFKAVFLFRPAMSRWHKFPAYQDTKIYCIYSPQDYTIWMGSLALYHPFGLAGARGFKNPYVKNVKSHGPHGHDFVSNNLEHWANFVDTTLKGLS